MNEANATLWAVTFILLIGYAALMWHYWRVLGERNEVQSKLARALVLVREYERWLSEFPEISQAMENLRAEMDGAQLDACWPPGQKGPWDVQGLREILRRRADVKATS